MFDKSLIGIIFYDNEGNLSDINQSALDIIKIDSLDVFKGHNLFNNPHIASKMEILLEKGLIKFQAPLDLNDENKDINSDLEKFSINWTVSTVDSGFLVQIQDLNTDNIEKRLQSEEKYRRFFEDDLTGDFIATPQGKIVECNPSFVDIYGFNNREKALNSDISKFNQNDWINIVERLEKEGKIQDFQSWHKRPDGSEIHIVANVVGVFNDLNELVQVKGYIFDDTERKKAEEDLIKSEEKYHRLFDEDLTGDFIANLDGEILECNPAFAEIYGFTDCNMALKWNISESNPFDWPYMVTRLKSEGKIKSFQSWQRRQDGMRIHVIANLVGIFNDSNELFQVKGYVFDDTERKNAEDELNRSKSQINEILDSIQDGFIVLNHFWNFIYVNHCAAKYFGLDADDLIGQNFWERFPELKGTIYENIFKNAIDKQEIQHFETHDGFNPDKWLDFSVYPSNRGLSILWKDITHKKPWKKDKK